MSPAEKELIARGYNHPRRHQITVTARHQDHPRHKVRFEGRQEYELHGIYQKPGMLRLVRALKGVGRPVCSLVRWKTAKSADEVAFVQREAPHGSSSQ